MKIEPENWIIISVVTLLVALIWHTSRNYESYTPEQKAQFWEAVAEGVNNGVQMGSQE